MGIKKYSIVPLKVPFVLAVEASGLRLVTHLGSPPEESLFCAGNESMSAMFHGSFRGWAVDD